MADSFISVPDIDLETPIKKARTNTRVVGAETVHEHYHIITDETNDTQARVLAVDPISTDAGLVVRNLPSGIQQVEGPTASGAASVENPVQIAGQIKTGLTGAGNVAPLVTAPDGDLIVHQQTGSVSFVDDVANTQRIPVNETDEGFFTYPVFPYYFDGSTWDRVRGSSTDGALVNLGANNDVSLNAGTNNIGDVDVLSIIPGTGATNLGKAEDSLHATGDTGVAMWGVRNDNGATTFGGNGDYCPIGVLANGSQYLGSVVPGTSATELGKSEDLASASGDVGVMALAKRLDTPVANANVNADADYLPLITDNLGKLWGADCQSEDSAHASTDRGSFSLAVRNDNLGTTYGADQDYAPRAVNGQGGAYKAVYRSTTTLTALNTTYDDSPTSATSASVDCANAIKFCLMYELTESGTATDITIKPEVSDDDSAFFPMREWKWVKYRFDDATIASYGTLDEGAYGEIIPRYLRFVVTATGTDASNTFTIANARVTIMNG